MKKYIRAGQRDYKFSLHDARISSFEFDYEKNNLRLIIDYGCEDIEKNKTAGVNIVIRDVSLENSYVYLIEYKNVLCGNIGRFEGEKLSLDTFIRAYPSKFSGVDVYGEYDGYQSFLMSGFMSRKGREPEETEVLFVIDYAGDFIYEIMD